MPTLKQLADQEILVSQETDPIMFTAIDNWSKKIFLGKNLNPELGPNSIREKMAKFTLAMLSLCPEVPIADESRLKSYIDSILTYYSRI